MFSVFAIAALGYSLGRITVRGINLGTAGVFMAAFYIIPCQNNFWQEGPVLQTVH